MIQVYEISSVSKGPNFLASKSAHLLLTGTRWLLIGTRWVLAGYIVLTSYSPATHWQLISYSQVLTDTRWLLTCYLLHSLFTHYGPAYLIKNQSQQCINSFSMVGIYGGKL